MVSPGGRDAALFFCSGPLEVCALAPELRHLGGQPYTRGDPEPPASSPDERHSSSR